MGFGRIKRAHSTYQFPQMEATGKQEERCSAGFEPLALSASCPAINSFLISQAQMSEYCIVPLKREHIDAVVDIHMQAFPDFFLSFLGRRFLRELYKAFAGDQLCVALEAVEHSGGKTLGFAVGTLKPSSFFGKLAKRRWWAFGISSLAAVAKNPRIATRIFGALAYRGGEPKNGDRALLSSIAVIPERQKTGLGSILLREWVETVRNKGCVGCYLTTDAVGNDSVNVFYANNGWRIESEYTTPEGRKMFRYHLDLK